MTINLKAPDIQKLKPRITVFGVGGAGGNAVNNMIECGLQGVEFVVANTDAQALSHSRADRVIQMGLRVTEGLGAGAQPEVGRAAAEEVMDELRDHLAGAHMVFITAGMGGGTGTGAAPVVARAAREMGILTVGVVTKPFQFEGLRRMRVCEAGITELQKHVDTLIVIPNQNLFRIANNKTTFAEAFAMADQVLYSGVGSITDLMVKPGLINLDFADVRAVMREMGKAMMGTGEASGENRALLAAEAAIANPLLDEVSMKGAKGLLISITGGKDMMLFELDEAASRIREEVDPEANIILGATQDDSLEGIIRVSVVATGIDRASIDAIEPVHPSELRIAEAAQRLREQAKLRLQPEPVIPMQRTAIETVAMAQPEPMPVHEAAAPITAAQETQAAAMPPVTETVPQPAYQPEPNPVEPQMVATAAVPPGQMAHPVAADQGIAAVPATTDATATVRPQRMPSVEDFPPHVIAQALAATRAAPAAGQPTSPVESRRANLLQRLAVMGFGRRDDGQAESSAPPVPVAPPRPAVAPVARNAHGQLDPHGRQPAASIEDEQLEIPAFLRRQTR